MERPLRMIFLLSALLLILASCGRQDKKPYISIIAKGSQHQFWQVVKNGAFKAQNDFGIIINFVAPVQEGDIEAQLELFREELDRNPDAICLAAQDTEAVLPLLAQAELKKVPVVAFDSGVPGATEDQVLALAATDNRAAAAIAAEKMYDEIRERLMAADENNPVYVAVLTQDYVSDSLISRTEGFTGRLTELAQGDGISAGTSFPGEKMNTTFRIIKAVSESTDISDVIIKAGDIFAMDNLVGVFCTNEGAANGLLALLEAGINPGGVVIAGFDAGSRQKEAVRRRVFLGSVSQDPHMIGYRAVEMAVKAAKGQPVAGVDTGAVWYDHSNMDNDGIRELLYN